MLITGKCHCGNIAFELEWEGDPAEIPARACGWKYAFGTRTATFHVCSRCGAVPLVTSEIANHLYAVVNVNVFENVDPARLRRATADFEGEDVESRLARRTRSWIADVRFVDARPDHPGASRHPSSVRRG